jgi:hypothetical protein
MPTATLNTNDVTGTLHYQIRWYQKLRPGEVWAHWGGGPNAKFAACTIGGEVYGAHGVFLLHKGNAWGPEPLDARLNPETPTTEANRLKIRDAVIAALESAAPSGHASIGNAIGISRSIAGDLRRIHQRKRQALSLAALDRELDVLDGIVEEE